MGVGDSDLIGRALDAAEAQAVEQSEPAEAPQVPEGTESTASDAVAEAHVADKIQKARDSAGKFAKSGKSPAAKAKQISSQVETDPEQGVEQVEGYEAETQGAPIDIPGMWKPEDKALLAKAPREVQELIARREAQRGEYERRLAREVEPAKAFMNKAREIFEPHRAKFQVNGVRDELDAVGRLFAWNEVFEKDPYTGIADLMRKNGLSGHDFLDNGSGQNQQYQSDPRLDEAMQLAEEARETARQLQEQLEGQRADQGRQFIEQFKAGKDSSGQSRGTFFEAYRPQIVAAYQEIQRQAPQMAEAEILNHAYEFALSEARKLHGVNGKAVMGKPNAPELARKAQTAAKSVTGAPAGEVASKSKLKGKDFNEKFEAAFANVAERVGL